MRVLRELGKGTGFSNRWLSHHLERYPDLDIRDRGLVTTLVYGVLRHRNRLDAHIDAHAHKPAGIRGEVRDVLRIAAFELRELDRPGGIAIAEARKAIRQIDRADHLGAVTQAILGAIDRVGAEFDAALEAAPPLDALERRWSIPRWMGGRWLKQLGESRARLRASLLAAPPPVDLRIDLSRSTAETIRGRLELDHPHATLETVPDQPQALRIRGGGDIFYGPLHDAGLISVQGLGAQQAARMLAPRPGERVLDACAGMGVKTLQLAELMHRRGEIVVADADPRKLASFDLLIRRGALQCEDLELSVGPSDLSQADPTLDQEPFDRILLDVPCTGLGNLARHPEIRWNRAFDDIAKQANVQGPLLRRNLDRLRMGGVLAYAACSTEPEEGPLVVRNARSDEFVIRDERTFTPEDDGTEGFYVAILQRR